MSHAVGPAMPPIPHGTIGAWLDATARTEPTREALVVPDQDVRWTWAELLDRVEAVAREFLTLGLQPGDRVGICAPPQGQNRRMADALGHLKRRSYDDIRIESIPAVARAIWSRS